MLFKKSDFLIDVSRVYESEVRAKGLRLIEAILLEIARAFSVIEKKSHDAKRPAFETRWVIQVEIISEKIKRFGSK